jgi:hypothetical protein
MGGEDGNALWSHRVSWADLIVSVSAEAGRAELDLREGWPRRWSVAWRRGRTEESVSVRDLARAPLTAIDPVRGFAWHRTQRHRPGLQFMVSTGRHHGFESLEEAKALMALDFAGDVVDVVSQPVKLAFETSHGPRMHTPDYLAVTRGGVWLIDVRPGHLIKPKDVESFAAAAEVALICGWRYVVVGGWHEHVPAALDAISSQRRTLSDVLGLGPDLLAAIGSGAEFGQVAAGSRCEPVARALLLHLIWARRVGVDLSMPLGDGSRMVLA